MARTVRRGRLRRAYGVQDDRCNHPGREDADVEAGDDKQHLLAGRHLRGDDLPRRPGPEGARRHRARGRNRVRQLPLPSLVCKRQRPRQSSPRNRRALVRTSPLPSHAIRHRLPDRGGLQRNHRARNAQSGHRPRQHLRGDHELWRRTLCGTVHRRDVLRGVLRRRSRRRGGSGPQEHPGGIRIRRDGAPGARGLPCQSQGLDDGVEEGDRRILLRQEGRTLRLVSRDRRETQRRVCRHRLSLRRGRLQSDGGHRDTVRMRL